MKSIRRSRLLYLIVLLAFLTIVTIVVLDFVAPAMAGPQADSKAFLSFITSPAEPIESYETEFSDSIEPWEVVRWKDGTVFNVKHNDGCDDGYCGFLDFEVDTTQTYANVSPLIVGPEPPYTIGFRAKLKKYKDRAQYGLVFGADWNDGACPGDNTGNCFNRYYEFRALFRDNKGDRYVQYRIRRIDGMDEDQNEAYYVTLVGWTRAEDVDAEDWIEWEVHYEADGQMTIMANGEEQKGSARDDKYGEFLYFGIGNRGGPNGGTEARIDKFGIAAE